MTTSSRSAPPPASSELAALHTYMKEAYGLAETKLRVAFRGQGNNTWQLHSGAVRRLLDKLNLHTPEGNEAFEAHYIDYHNNSLLTPARQRGLHIEAGAELNDLQLLAKLQHFGAATGLLDFTLNPLVALWFACQQPDVNGTVFVYDIAPSMSDSLSWDNLSSNSFSEICSSLGKSSGHIGWEPSALGETSPRITAQQSFLVLLHPQVSPSRLAGTIPINHNDKAVLLRQLRVFGIGEDSLFRDVYGFALANAATAPQHRIHASANTLLETANRHYMRREYERAIANYTDLMKRFADSEDIRFYRANAYAEARMNTEALDDYGHALSHREHLSRVPVAAVLLNRGNLLARTGDHDAAVTDYSEAIELRGKFRSASFNRANSYFSLGRFDEAVFDYKATAGYHHAMFNQGNAHMALGQFRDAVECYENALSLGWNTIQLRNNLDHARKLDEALQGVDVLRDSGRHDWPVKRTVEFKLPAGADSALLDRPPIVLGNAGNIGNEGAPSLSGGEGSDGDNPFVLRFFS